MPDRKIIREFKRLRKLKKSDTITDEQSIELDDFQEKMIFDMLPEFEYKDHERFTDIEYDQLSMCCWRIYGFFKRKSLEHASGSS